MDKKNGYVGKVKNAGTQFVQAPLNVRVQHKGTKRVSGNDLRNGVQGADKSKK